jgi:tetratricopeptide (TPR) repeat protein
VAAAGLVLLALLLGIIGTSAGMISANRAWHAEKKRAEAERLAKLESENRLVQIEKGNAILADMFKDLDVRETANPDAPLESVLGERLVNVNVELKPEVIGDPATLAKLKRQLAVSLINLGRWHDAEKILLEVIELQKTIGSLDTSEMLKTNNELGRVLLELGDYSRASETLQVGFDSSVQLDTQNSIESIDRMRLLGITYRLQGKLDEGQALLQPALELAKNQFGSEHRMVVVIANDLAALYQTRGEFDLAIPLFEESLELSKKIHGEFHHNTIEKINNLALARRENGDIEVAARLLQRAYESGLKRRGKKHPEVLRSLMNWGEVLSEQGEHTKAIELLSEARQGFEETVGPHHRDTVYATIHLANAEMANQSIERAAKWYEQALKSIQLQPSPDRDMEMVCLEKMANCRWILEDLAAAVEHFESLLLVQKKELGSDHLKTVVTIANLGILNRDLNRIDRGIELMEEAYSKVGEYPSLLSVRKELRNAYVQKGSDAAARKLIESEVAEIRAAKTATLDLAAEFTRLSAELLELKRYQDCEGLLSEAFRIRQIELPNDWRTFNTQSMLGEAMVGQVVKLREMTLSPDDTNQVNHEEVLSLAGAMLLTAYEGLRSQQEVIPPHARAERLTQAVDRLIAWAAATRNEAERKRWEQEREKLNGSRW